MGSSRRTGLDIYWEAGEHANRNHVVTEVAIRGVWQYDRETMGFDRLAA